MPIKHPKGKKVRYRWKKTKSGKKIRLAFINNKVVEVKKKGGKAKRVSSLTRKRRRIARRLLS